MSPPTITSFLVKVASRCNLDCDYCYVYHHADQSWRDMPKLLSPENQTRFVQRLSDYARDKDLTRCAVVFHGGEPLLAGAENLASFARQIRAATTAKVDIGLQTNGLLLDQATLDILEQAEIAVSLSLDGPKQANDKHRKSRRGRSSFDKVEAALELLKKRPKVFAGVIAVIDPTTSAAELFAFFDGHAPPKLDFLLPDAHHLRQPPGRDEDPAIYTRWLTEAFDLWLDHYPHLPVRTFESLLDAISGLPSSTDAFGFGDVSLISIETDGSFHDLDVLKITGNGATRLCGTLADTSIAEVSASEALSAHQSHLRRDGLCPECQSCGVVTVCGGGSLPHRFGENGFKNPTVYCTEMKALISHIERRIGGMLTSDAQASPRATYNTDSIRVFESAEIAGPTMESLCADATDDAVAALRATLRSLPDAQEATAVLERLGNEEFRHVASQPGIMAWRHTMDAITAGRIVHAVDGKVLNASADYLDDVLRRRSPRQHLAIGDNDLWLRAPFGDAIQFEEDNVARAAKPVVQEALNIVELWRPALAAEMRMACKAIQFVRDPLAHSDKIVSFSDNSVPGALYVSVRQGEGLIDPYDLADSLIHEHRHQKLYLLERHGPTVEPTKMTVRSPWREDPRPPSGLLHAVFVFVELQRFWIYVRNHGPSRLHNRAVNQLHDTESNLGRAFDTLERCPLTKVGHELVGVLKNAAHADLKLCASA